MTVALSPRRMSRREAGFTLIELLIVVAIILIIAAIAFPRLTAARTQAQEMSAIRHIGVLHTAQAQYYSQFGKYAGTLTELGPPSSGQGGPQAADLIPGDLATGKKGGYTFTVAASPAGYTVTAVPDVFGQTGKRTFYSDQSLTVRNNWSAEPATAQSEPIK